MQKNSRKKSKIELELDLDYDEEPDWEALTVTPMSQSATKKFASTVWDYFGQLMRDSICMDNKNFYCLPCFQNQRLKQYSATTATSNFYTHLKAYHNLCPERGIPLKRRTLCVKDTLKPTEDETGNYSELLEGDNTLNELIVVGRGKEKDNNTSVDEKPHIVSITKKRNYKKRFVPVERKTFGGIPYEKHSYTPHTAVPLKSEESERTEDYDRLFILSLVKEFRKVPENYRLDAKYDLLGVLRKYQQAGQTHHHTSQEQDDDELEDHQNSSDSQRKRGKSDFVEEYE